MLISGRDALGTTTVLAPFEVAPINVGPQALARHSAERFAVQVDAELFPQILAGADGLAEVSDGRAATLRERVLLFRGKGVEVGAQSVHGSILLLSNVKSRTVRYRLVLCHEVL